MDSDTENNINPEHYRIGGIETWDYMVAKLTKEELIGYVKGNVLKYITREKHKGELEDIKKAQWYINNLVYHVEANKDNPSSEAPYDTAGSLEEAALYDSVLEL